MEAHDKPSSREGVGRRSGGGRRRYLRTILRNRLSCSLQPQEKLARAYPGRALRRSSQYRAGGERKKMIPFSKEVTPFMLVLDRWRLEEGLTPPFCRWSGEPFNHRGPFPELAVPSWPSWTDPERREATGKEKERRKKSAGLEAPGKGNGRVVPPATQLLPCQEVASGRVSACLTCGMAPPDPSGCSTALSSWARHVSPSG